MSSVADRIKKALELRGMGQNSLDRALGKKQGYTSMLLGRDSEPLLSGGSEIAKILGVRLEWLATGEGPMDAVDESPAPPASSGPRAKTAKDLPGWTEALAAAAARWRRIPASAWGAIAMLSFDNPPERITPELLFKMAQGWLAQASDDELAKAEEADIRRVMAEEDAAYMARTSPLAPVAIPTKPGPTKAVPRKKSAKLEEGFPCSSLQRGWRVSSRRTMRGPMLSPHACPLAGTNWTPPPSTTGPGGLRTGPTREAWRWPGGSVWCLPTWEEEPRRMGKRSTIAPRSPWIRG